MSTAAPQTPTAAPLPRRRDWSPSIWLGCDVVSLVQLLARHRFAVHRSRWHVLSVAAALSVGHSLLGLVQRAVYGRRVRHTLISQAPVFILGHWRTGTTLLHELLAQDPRFGYPTTYQCFAPHHFLVSESWLPRLFGWLVPSRRPMDNMAAGWDRPQEDEFALCMLGQPSPYARLAFPNRPDADAGAFDLSSLSPRAVRRWKVTFVRLLKEFTLANGGRRLLLKSPPHTFRIPVVRELFPDARFIHLVRDPYDVFPSTLHLWRMLSAVHGLQRPNWAGLPEYVLDTFARMYSRLEADRHLIPSGRFHELRYEDLIRDPLARLGEIYRALDLGDFEPARAPVEAYLIGVRGYETNCYTLTRSERRAITERWGGIIRRYGYALRTD